MFRLKGGRHLNHWLLLHLLLESMHPRSKSGKELFGFLRLVATPALRQKPTNEQIDNDDKENEFHNLRLGKSACNWGDLLKL